MRDDKETFSTGEHALHVPGQWQPIETAPKDGTWVLLSGGRIDYDWCGRDKPATVVGQYTTRLNGVDVAGHWQFAWYDGGYYGEYEAPTHWMPLPANTGLSGTGPDSQK